MKIKKSRIGQALLLGMLGIAGCAIENGTDVPPSPPRNGTDIESKNTKVDVSAEAQEWIESDESQGAPPRVFTCDRVVDSPQVVELGAATDDDGVRFQVEFGDGCEGVLEVVQDGVVEKLDPRGRVYTNVSSTKLGATRVACFGVVELGNEVGHPAGIGNHVLSTAVECSTTTDGGWAQPKVVLSATDTALWLLGFESDGSLSYLRDSLFAPGMLSRVGRPALDGFWRARPSFENGELVLLDAEQVDLMPVER